MGISTWLSLNIKTVEDISKMIPIDDELERYNFATKHIKLNDRIIIRVFSTESIQGSTEKLIEFADSLSNVLAQNYAEHITEIQNTVSQNAMTEVYNIFLNYLPVFLEDEDYLSIENKLKEDEIQKTLEANYKTLISPASMVTKKFIKDDPLSITPIALTKLNYLQFDENYEIFDNHILTKDKKSLLLFITSKYSNDETASNKKLIDGINQSLKEIKKQYPGTDAELFGAPVISVGNADRIKKDIILTVSIALFVLFFFLLFFYRRIIVFFVIFLPVVFGALVSLAIIQMIQGEVSAVSLGIGSILTGISIDYSLHIFTHFRSKNKASGIFKDIATPLLLSSLTTASAFFCLFFVSSDALKDLGMFAGIAVIASSLFALIVLPHFLKEKNKTEEFTHRKNLFERFAAFKFHKSKTLVILILLITCFSLFSGKAGFESDMDKMNYMSPELKKAEKYFETTGNDALRKMYFVVTGKTLEEALIKNDVLADQMKSLKQKGIVKEYVSVRYFLSSDSLQNIKIKHSKDFWNAQRISKLETDLKNYGKIYGFKENAFSGFIERFNMIPSKLDEVSKQKLIEVFGKELITLDKEMVSIVTLIKLEQKDKDYIYKSIKEDTNTYIVDKKYITDKIVLILKKDFNLLVIISMFVVFLILLMYYGRIELTLITVLPLLISWLWTLSLMWVFDLKFTIFNIVISTFIFGLGIDYSIFVSRGLLQKYRFGYKNLKSYKTSVLLSGITTITAIGVLIFAKHPAMKSIALLSILGISSVIFITYTLLPILFNFLIKQQGKKRSLPVTFKDLFFGISVFIFFIITSLLSGLIRLLLALLPARKKYKKLLFHKWLHINSLLIAYIPLNVKKIINNPFKEDFRNPAVIISNHQSHIDIPLLLMLHPKILILTNDWVQKNVFYGRIVKYADYYPISEGFEKNLVRLKEKIKEGYSILIFPEGSRSNDLEIKRFHKGAFEYAKALNIDILPIIIQGAGDCIPKGEPFLKSGQITVNIMQRLSVNEYSSESREMAKKIRIWMQDEYQKIRQKYETPAYFRRKLIANYIYKTPVVEHYTRIKTRIERNYEFFDKILPKSGHITDIGTGYGYLPYMLSFMSKNRTVTGIDYDADKIMTASHNISMNDQLTFICEDVTKIDLPESDAFILNDVLHYMPQDEQKKLILKCIDRLKPNGQILIRDGNKEMVKKHKGTKLSEYFSTKLLKFNKTGFDGLHFTSKSEILEIIKTYNFDVSIVDETKFTSNIVFLIKKS
jgi:1-acyl-sn-glycerol-3-phosphate acyltransferase